jgi:glycosyltransferase involved in cell wall biosynthesis
MSTAEVSVVMSVYNGAEYLEQTLASILSQKGCDLEFVVVDDGSTDDTGRILDGWAAREERLRVIHQQNTGLTRALIRGCAQARGEFIARQDAGDVSLPGRLSAQSAQLRRSHDIVAVSCFTEFYGPKGEFLYRVEIDASTLNQTLMRQGRGLAGPSHHGSVMMRRAAYEAAGGYRDAFYFAQDLDLWSRLIERGRFEVVEDVLYRARLELNSISGVQTTEQNRLARLIADASSARRDGGSESQFLEAAANICPAAMNGQRRRLARGSYFMGSCLRQRDHVAAAGYFLQAAMHDPTHWRAWVRLVESKIKSIFWT